MNDAVITVSKPWRESDGDHVKFTLHPRVKNYSEVACAVESIVKDGGAFKEYKHPSGGNAWEVILVDGTKLDGIHDQLAGQLNYILPSNIKAIPEGAVEAFEEGDPPAKTARVAKALALVRAMRRESHAARLVLERVDGIADEAESKLEAVLKGTD